MPDRTRVADPVSLVNVDGGSSVCVHEVPGTSTPEDRGWEDTPEADRVLQSIPRRHPAGVHPG